MPTLRFPVRAMVLLAGISLVVLAGCGGDDGGTSADPPADGNGTVVTEGGVGLPEDPDEEGMAAGGEGSTPPLACPGVEEVEAITGVDITRLSGPAAGDPTPLTCQYVGDAEEFSTGTAVRINLNPVDTGPIDLGRSVDGFGEWAEVSAEDGGIYVGFGDSVLEIETYAELTDDQLVALVEATIEAGSAG